MHSHAVPLPLGALLIWWCAPYVAQGGIYKEIAVPFKGGEFRKVSLALFAQALADGAMTKEEGRAAHGAHYPRRAPCPRCTAESMLAPCVVTGGEGGAAHPGVRERSGSLGHHSALPTPFTLPSRRCTADSVHRVCGTGRIARRNLALKKKQARRFGEMSMRRMGSAASRRFGSARQVTGGLMEGSMSFSTRGGGAGRSERSLTSRLRIQSR